MSAPKSSHRHSVGGLTNSKRPVGHRKTRHGSLSIQAECLYGIQEHDDGTHKPMLSRYIKCQALMPADIPLQSTSRVIAMLKCFRQMHRGARARQAAPMIETIFSQFTRVWPQPGTTGMDDYPSDAAFSKALVVHSKHSGLDFNILLPTDLPQSIAIPGGSIFYTVQLQASLRNPSNVAQEESLYSQELTVDVPAPDTAYSARQLPKRLTNGSTGQAQDHYGILVSPEISLHVSIPQEICYSRQVHSIFKIHLKLTPHPPEAKLPPVSRLTWNLTQRTDLGSILLDGSHTSKPIGVAEIVLASGQIVMPTHSDASDAMSAGRKDQYIYIALPENSTSLLAMCEDNRYLEILHQLKFELFLDTDAMKNNGTGKSTGSFWSKAFSRKKEVAKQAVYKAEIPIKLLFDMTDFTKSTVDGNVALNRLTIEAPV